MGQISLLQIARLLGSNTGSGMAQKVGLHWPPPPPVSLRNTATLAELPLQPSNLQIWFVTDGVGQAHPPDSTDVPVAGQTLSWSDPGASSLRQAKTWEVTVRNETTGVDWGGRPFSSNPGDPLALPGPNQLEYSTPYEWWVVPINDFGRGPASPGFTFRTVSAPPPPPPVPPSISVSSAGQGATAVFTVTGSGFKANDTVYIRVVDDAFHQQNYEQGANGTNLNARISLPCNSGLTLHFSAHDSRPNPADPLTNTLWSNTFDIPCP